MKMGHSVAFIALTLGCIHTAAAQDAGPIGRTMNREATRLAWAQAFGDQPDPGPSDAHWAKLGRHIGEKVAITTRARGDIRGALRASGPDAVDIEKGRQIVRVSRADVCDILKQESPFARNARWGAVGGLAGLGVGFLLNVGQGLAEVREGDRTCGSGATLATGAMAGFTLGWLVGNSQPPPIPTHLYADYDRTDCR
jgi:hypothetical protein